MIACIRARGLSRGLSHVSRRRPPLVLAGPVPRLGASSCVGIGRFSFSSSSTTDPTSSDKTSSPSGSGDGSSGTSVDGSAADGSATPPPELGTSGFDPSSLIPPPPSAEPWSTSVPQFVADLPGTLSSLLGDAGIHLLKGVLTTGMHIIGGVQAGVQEVHHLTGLPWWATIGVATICVKVSLLPVVLYQARHVDRMRMAWPEIQLLRDHLATTLDQIPQRRVLARWEKYKIFFSGTRGILGLHGTHLPGLFATPMVNLPVFVLFVWSIRGMLRDATVPGLDTGGILWFVDLTATDSSLMLPIIGTSFTYTSLELAKMKGATGWIKFFQDGMQTFTILMLPWVSTFPQGVFMYWIPSAAFQMSQTYALRNNAVREFIGLKPIDRAPMGAAGRHRREQCSRSSTSFAAFLGLLGAALPQARMDPTTPRDPHANSDVGNNLADGGRGDGDARPAAPKQEGEDRHRTSATKKGLQMLKHPVSPIKSLTKKLIPRPSRGASQDGFQALSGSDKSGEFVMTPVGSEGGRVGDVEVSSAGSDDSSEASGESVEGRGDGDGDGGAAGVAGVAGRPKRAGKIARGFSQGLKLMKKRPMGVSQTLTIGRASLMGDRDSDNSYLRARDVDGEGARSYTGGWGKRPSSPEHGAREIPQDWKRPVTNIPASSSAAQGQAQAQAQDMGMAVSWSASGSRPTSPLPSPIQNLGMPPTKLPQMQRGQTEPCTAHSSARSLASPRTGDLAKVGRDYGSGSGEVCRTPSTASPGATPGGHSAQSVQEQQETGAPASSSSRGRPLALGKSKSVSPKGEWGVGVDVRGQARSVSAERKGERRTGRIGSRSPSPRGPRSPFSRSRSRSRPQTPQSAQSAESYASVRAQDDTNPGTGSLPGFHGEGDGHVQPVAVLCAGCSAVEA
eukprot:g4633.t1